MVVVIMVGVKNERGERLAWWVLEAVDGVMLDNSQGAVGDYSFIW